MRYLLPLAVAILVTSSVSACFADQPSLAMAASQDTVTMKIVSSEVCADPVVHLKDYDQGTYEIVEMDSFEKYQDQKTLNYTRYAYFFKTKVVQGHRYAWSFNSSNHLGPYNFKIRDLTGSINPRFIQIGDMEYGYYSNETLKALNGMDWDKYDGLIHVGDFAYNLEFDDCTRGDFFFNSMSSVHPVTPCYFILGNHENYNNGKMFNYRFRMAGYNTKYENHFTSQIRGRVFFLYVNYDYVLKMFPERFKEVIAFLDSELEKSKTPDIKWSVVVTHRPIYCGEYDTRSDCTLNYYKFKAFEQLYRKHGVDIMISGHEHFYERLTILDDQFRFAEVDQKIGNMKAEITNSEHPIQLTNGCAGNHEFVDPDLKVAGFTSNSIAWIQCYADIEFTEDSIIHQLKASRDGTVMDTTIIHKKPKPTFAWISLVYLGIFMAATMLVFFAYKSMGIQKEDLNTSDACYSAPLPDRQTIR